MSHPIAHNDPVNPPDALLPDTFAARLYGMLAPVAQYDPLAAWSLLILNNAVGGMYQLVEDWVRDTDNGDPGWSLLMDLTRCPDEALPWLGQFVGVRLLASSTPDAQRARIASTDGFHRGTRDALVGAARATLTGAQQVIFRERSGDPATQPIDYAYYLDVITYIDQTPDPTATLNALMAQKPAGIVLNYRTAVGQDYLLLYQTNTDYAAVYAKYPTYEAVRLDEPG